MIVYITRILQENEHLVAVAKPPIIGAYLNVAYAVVRGDNY